MNKSEKLIDDYLNDSLDETGMSELQTWLAKQESNMRIFTEVLMLEEEIRTATRARENTNSANQLPQPATPEPQAIEPPRNECQSKIDKPRRLARAAAWLGAFTWLGDKAQASIIMNKTIVTTVTAAVVLAAGTTTYIIRERNHRTEPPINIAGQQSTSQSG